MRDVSFYIARAKDESLLHGCSSGGVCHLISKHIIETEKGVVYGAAFDEERLCIRHIRVTSVLDLDKIKKSKYVWSNIKDCIELVEKDLITGRKVLFIGTPCQCEAIVRKYGEFSNLLVVDFFCHGTLMPEYLKDYLESLDVKVKHIDFRAEDLKKKFNFIFEINDGNKTIISENYSENMLTNLFVSSLGLRKACFSCKFATEKHLTGITVGDFEFDEIAKKYGFHNKFHLSVICINNDSGKMLFDSIKNKRYIKKFYKKMKCVRSFISGNIKILGKIGNIIWNCKNGLEQWWKKLAS